MELVCVLYGFFWCESGETAVFYTRVAGFRKKIQNLLDFIINNGNFADDWRIYAVDGFLLSMCLLSVIRSLKDLFVVF